MSSVIEAITLRKLFAYLWSLVVWASPSAERRGKKGNNMRKAEDESMEGKDVKGTLTMYWSVLERIDHLRLSAKV